MLTIDPELQLISKRLESAKSCEEVFGVLKGTQSEQLRDCKTVFHILAKSTHEDRFLPESEKSIAREAFILLSEWWNKAENKIKNKTYGDYIDHTKVKPKYKPLEMKLRDKTLRLDDILGQGSFSTVYQATYEGIIPDAFVFVKVARTPQDNDLLEREYETLQLFQQKDKNPAVEKFMEGQRTYIPYPITSFYLSGEKGIKYRATIYSVPKGRSFTVETLRKEKFPNGIDAKHMYWVLRRLLLTLWMAHLKGIVHGAVTPEHILVYPEEHGLVLLDWTCSTKIGKKVPAYNPDYVKFISPEILLKEGASPAMDIYMAAVSAIYSLNGDHRKRTIPGVPKPVADLILECLDIDVSKRPQDAEFFHNRFGSIIGKREFTKFIVP